MFPTLAVTPLITEPVPIFLTVLVIMLLAPILLNQLRVPHVIGLILAGVAVGPYGANLLARDMSFEVFGQVGILYLMFLAGLEIDMYNLKRNLRQGLFFGFITFLVPLIIGIAGGRLFLHLDGLSSVLLASMFAAHTLIAYPIVSRFGLSKNPAVVIAVAGTIMTVLGSLVVVASVSGVYREGSFSVGNLLWLLGNLVIFCVVALYVYPRLTRWFFRKYSDGILQFVYILAMVFLAATVAKWIGIEGVFGAFFAGLTLNRYIPARSRLMSRIEFVGNAIFIPYFLIGVGMLINVKVIASNWTTVYVATVMSLIAMSGKWVAAFITQLRFKMAGTDRSMMYQLSNAHTAVALAVVMIGYGMGLFDESILNGTIVMILVTCTISSFGTARAAARIKMLQFNESALGNGSSKYKRRPRRSLVNVSSPLSAPQLVDLAMFMGRTDSLDSKMYALHVRSDNSASSRAIGRNSLDVAEHTAAAAYSRLKPIERFDLNVVTGVLNTISERDINEIYIGLHRRTAIIDSFYGNKLEQLLKATNRMVVISRCYIPVNTVRRIVVSVPAKAQFETGFRQWVEAIGNLAIQVGCRVIFCCPEETKVAIESVYRSSGYQFSRDYRFIDTWDDFVLLANKIQDEDLFIVVNSRRQAVSYNSDMDLMPDFLQRYFSNNNLIILFPEQSGEPGEVETMAEVMSTDMISAPSPLTVKAMHLYRKLNELRRRYMRRSNNRDSFDL